MNGNPPSLAEVRERLKRQGYLDTGLERAIFTAPRASGAILPSVLTGAAACSAASAAAAAVRGAVSPAPGALLLFLCLFLVELPLAAVGGALFYAATRAFRVPENARRASYLAAVLAAAAVFALFTVGVRSLPAGGAGSSLVSTILVGVAAFYFARAVRATSLSLALRRQVDLPASPFFRRGTALAVAALLIASTLVAWRSRKTVPFPPLTVAASPRPPLVVVALDGVSPAMLAGLFPEGPRVAWRRAEATPPEVWSTVATGVSAQRHGVRAFERVSVFRRVAARVPWGCAWAFRGPLRWVGIAGRLPVSGAERRAYTFWEIAAKVGVPTLAVNWWASEPVPGAVVVDNSEIARGSGSGSDDDARSIARFELERDRQRPRLSTLYLPGADIDRGPLTRPALGFLKAEASRARRGEESLWIVFDAGRSGAGGGLWMAGPDATAGTPNRAAGSSPPGARPEDVAPTVLARLGIPAAEDLGGFPLPDMLVAGALEKARVATYGTRASREPEAGPTEAGREYLQRLKSLGYLN